MLPKLDPMERAPKIPMRFHERLTTSSAAFSASMSPKMTAPLSVIPQLETSSSRSVRLKQSGGAMTFTPASPKPGLLPSRSRISSAWISPLGGGRRILLNASAPRPVMLLSLRSNVTSWLAFITPSTRALRAASSIDVPLKFISIILPTLRSWDCKMRVAASTWRFTVAALGIVGIKFRLVNQGLSMFMMGVSLNHSSFFRIVLGLSRRPCPTASLAIFFSMCARVPFLSSSMVICRLSISSCCSRCFRESAYSSRPGIRFMSLEENLGAPISLSQSPASSMTSSSLP
mmetsp:Transcript_60954/g.193345  ORF Transcript_60954/g.193345 Transcript_60954/m.193345 type:complete len:288 (-) Transcript_60954:715-1578(-)